MKVWSTVYRCFVLTQDRNLTINVLTDGGSETTARKVLESYLTELGITNYQATVVPVKGVGIVQP